MATNLTSSLFNTINYIIPTLFKIHTAVYPIDGMFQAAPVLESEAIAEVPKMQATVDRMHAEAAAVKTEADAVSTLTSLKLVASKSANHHSHFHLVHLPI